MLKNVNILPMDRNRVLRNYFVLAKDGFITKLGPMSKITQTTRNIKIINGRGGYLLPGLFDMHVHIDPNLKHQFYNLFLAHGITAVRDTGNSSQIFRMKYEIERGKILGPRLFVCGSIFEGDPPIWDKQFSKIVASAAEARSLVRYYKRKGADFIKVYSTLSPSVHKAIISEAHRLSLKVTGHIPYTMDIFGVVAHGQDGIEHMDHVGQDAFLFTFRNFYPRAQKLLHVPLDKKRFRKLVAVLRRKGVAVCPTLPLVLQSEVHTGFRTHTVPSPRLLLRYARWLPRYIREKSWNPDRWIRYRSHAAYDNRALFFRKQQKLLPMIQKRGVLLLAGSDTANPYVVPGISLHQELKLMVESGLTPFEALSAATRNAAKFLGVHSKIGTIDRGKTANLVLFHKNPLQRISNLRTIKGVILAGKYFPRKKLFQKVRVY